jgi:DnaJ-class molecular chaperone
MPKRTIVCPKCNGEGIQLDKGMVGIANVFFPVFWTMDKLIGGDMFDEPCNRCDGEGWIEIGRED